MAIDLRQDHFRFGLNSGNESTHGWLAAEDTNISMVPGVTFLLRYHIQNAGTTADANLTCTWQYNKNGAGWNNITTTSSVVKSVTPKTWANNANTTNRLTGSGTFETSSAGCTTDGTSGGTAQDIAGSGQAEDEIALKIVDADVANGDTIQFKMVGTTAITLTVTAQLTVDKTIRTGALVSTGIITTIRLLRYLANQTSNVLSFAGTIAGVKGGAGPASYSWTGAGVLSAAGAIFRKAITKTFAGAVSSSGAYTRRIDNLTRTYTGAVASSGAYTRVINKLTRTYSGALSSAGSYIRTINNLTRTYVGALTSSGAISRLIDNLTRTYSGIINITGESIGEVWGKITKSGVLSFTGTIEKAPARVRTYLGTLSASGATTRLINLLTRTYSGTATFVGTITRSVSQRVFTRTYSGAISFVGSTLGATIVTYGTLKRWNGTAWVKEPLKVYLAGAWVSKPLKRWNGTSWVLVDTSGV